MHFEMSKDLIEVVLMNRGGQNKRIEKGGCIEWVPWKRFGEIRPFREVMAMILNRFF